MNEIVERPLSITIIAFLGIIGSLIIIVLSLMSLVSPLTESEALNVGNYVLLAIAIPEFVVSFGIFSMKKWAWYLVLIVYSILIILSLITFNIGAIIIPSIVLFYLWKYRNLFK